MSTGVGEASSGDGDGVGKSAGSGDPTGMEVTPKPTPPVRTAPQPGEAPSPEKIAIEIETRLEARLISIFRREVRDPYGGLPADDVLARLDDRFPGHDFPGRMLKRLEAEQDARHAHLERLDATEQYTAETVRMDAEQDRGLQRSWGQRAERVTAGLVVAGLLLIFTDHEMAGIVVLGTTLVGVVGAFLSQTIRDKKTTGAPRNA